jgi:hypothetical protein
MYNRDPRDEWTPAMAHYFGRQPETMKKLTPGELDALVKSTNATVKAAQR